MSTSSDWRWLQRRFNKAVVMSYATSCFVSAVDFAHFIPSILRMWEHSSLELLAGPDGELPERLRNLEPKLIEHISNEIMTKNPNVHWDDIGEAILTCQPYYPSSNVFQCLVMASLMYVQLVWNTPKSVSPKWSSGR